jgi:hypothetical protein
MIFGRKGKSNDFSFNLKLNDICIEKVQYTKFLGVYIDENLSWKKHTSEIASKISKGIGIINKVKTLLPRIILKTLYLTLIQPYFIYCNIIWGNASRSALNNLIVLQKRVIRLICHAHYQVTTSPLFKQCNILKLPDIYKFQVGQFVFKSLNNFLPISCSLHIKRNFSSHQYALRNNPCTIAAPFKTKYRINYVGVSGPKLWNSLPECLTSSPSFVILKKSLKDYLLNQY